MSGTPPLAPTPSFDDASALQQSTRDAVSPHKPISDDTSPHQNLQDVSSQTRSVGQHAHSTANEEHNHQLKDVTQACQHICSDAVRQHITISHDTTPTHKQEDNSSLTPLIGTTAVASHDEPSTTVPQCCDSNPANEEQNQQLNSSVSHKLEDKASRTPSGCTIVSQGEPSTTVPPCCNSTSVNKEQNHQLSDSMTQSASAPPTVASQPPTQPLTGEFIALDSTADATLPTPPPPGPSHKIKRRRSSRRSKRKSLKEPEVAGSTNVLGGIYPLSQQSQMSSDQVQSEIQAIDSILKALNTGGYSMSSMDTLPQLTGGTNNTLQMAPTSVTKDVDGAKVHQAVKAASSGLLFTCICCITLHRWSSFADSSQLSVEHTCLECTMQNSYIFTSYVMSLGQA
jgi:hypothetical protein